MSAYNVSIRIQGHKGRARIELYRQTSKESRFRKLNSGYRSMINAWTYITGEEVCEKVPSEEDYKELWDYCWSIVQRNPNLKKTDNTKERFKMVTKGLVVYITARKRKDYRAVMVILRKTRNGKKCIVCEDYQHFTREWKNHSKQLVEDCSEYTIEEYLADMPSISEIRDEMEDVIQKTKDVIGPSIAVKRWHPELLKHIEVTDPGLAARLIRPRGTKAAA